MWVTPITDRTLNDVRLVETIYSEILENGFDSLSQSDKDFWLGSDIQVLYGTDYRILTSDSEPIIFINQLVKGSFNVIDLLRIEYNIQYLSDVLNDYGYYNIVSTKLDWIMGDFPKLSELDRIKTNLQNIEDAFVEIIANPDLNIGDLYLDYEDVNDIETIIYNTKIAIENMENLFRYCGTLNCGTDFQL